MPPMLIALLVLLVIFAWFLIGDKTSFSEKMTFLLIILSIYAGYRLLRGDSLSQIFVQPLKYFINRS